MHISYPDTLPVTRHRDEIIRLLASEQVIIVAGDTGSGKTTQLPKFCLEAFPVSSTLIGCTQPRRVAAVSVSARVAEELGTRENIVGYKIRFHDHTTPNTRIKFMTDGVLLAETLHDPLLQKYGIIILDEAHERSLNVDFLLGLFKNILTRRKDLKLIITSATIDTAAFSSHFSDAPVVLIKGKTYPVEVRYFPVPEDQFSDKDGYIEHCVQTITRLYMTEPPGDILAFLPTEQDIRTCCDLLEGQLDNVVILPMFGRLQAADQRKIFNTYKQTKIVVATNIAETSITVPGIRYVVDSGLARISIYNARARTTGLPITRVSRASCNQRKGRCGRIAPGVCVRLYSEEDYLDRDEYTLPEIRRSNLAAVVLQMLYLNLGDPLTFPFIDKPHPNAVKDGLKLLTELGAIEEKRSLTRYGKIMATMSIDPCISRVIIEAATNGSLREIRIIASAIAIQDPRVRPAQMEKQADDAHKQFAHPKSDFLSLLNIWNLFHDVQDGVRSWSRLKKFCKSHFLSYQRMREWLDLHDQMGRILERHQDFSEHVADSSYQMIHSALAAGFLRNIALKKKDKIYQGASGRELMIFPGSHQFLKGGQWIIAASFVETTRLYALTVATIESEWLEDISKHLSKYSWSHPHWEKKTGQVIAEEKVTLFGLPIITGRKVNFGRRDRSNRQQAREIFIANALLTGEIRGTYPFLQHNLNIIAGWQETETKLRKRDILVDDTALFTFYDHRLGEDVYDRYTLNRFLKKNGQKTLMMEDCDILKREPHANELADFPPSLTIGSLQLKLEYHFEPGVENDGVTVRIPAAVAATLNPEIFEWLVPGLLREKTIFLLKGLPKNIRKQFIPLNNTVDLVLDSIINNQGSYYRALERALLKMFSKTIRRSDWPKSLPQHLLMRFELFDQEGKVIASGRNFNNLLLSFGKLEDTRKTDQLITQKEDLISFWKNHVVSNWEFSAIPLKIELYTVQRHEIAGFLYPAVQPVPEKGGVTICFENTQDTAQSITTAGMSYLYRLQFPDQFKVLKRFCTTKFSGPSSLWLTEGFGNSKQAVDQLLDFIVRELFKTGSGTIHSKQLFTATVAEIKSRGFYKAGMEICETVLAVLRRRREVKSQILRYEELSKKTNSYSIEKNKEHLQLLEEILPANFLKIFNLERLSDCDRYLRGLSIRAERAHVDYSKEENKKERLRPHLHNYEMVKKKEAGLNKECLNLLREFETLINEFRISLFSPEIGTKISVSEKKLAQHWRKMNEICLSFIKDHGVSAMP